MIIIYLIRQEPKRCYKRLRRESQTGIGRRPITNRRWYNTNSRTAINLTQFENIFKLQYRWNSQRYAAAVNDSIAHFRQRKQQRHPRHQRPGSSRTERQSKIAYPQECHRNRTAESWLAIQWSVRQCRSTTTAIAAIRPVRSRAIGSDRRWSGTDQYTTKNAGAAQQSGMISWWLWWGSQRADRWWR